MNNSYVNPRRMVMTCSLFGVLLMGASGAAGSQCEHGAFLTIGGTPSVAGRAAAGDKTQLRMTEAELVALPTTTITTSTEWTPVSRFEGPLLSDVLQRAAVRSGTLSVFAVDDYSISIPWSDLASYGPILAHTRDGQRMTRRRFGPLFVIYPRDKFASLQTPSIGARMAWQVCRIEVD